MELIQKIGSWLAALSPVGIFCYWILGKMLKSNADSIQVKHDIDDTKKEVNVIKIDLQDHEERIRKLEQ